MKLEELYVSGQVASTEQLGRQVGCCECCSLCRTRALPAPSSPAFPRPHVSLPVWPLVSSRRLVRCWRSSDVPSWVGASGHLWHEGCAWGKTWNFPVLWAGVGGEVGRLLLCHWRNIWKQQRSLQLNPAKLAAQNVSFIISKSKRFPSWVKKLACLNSRLLCTFCVSPLCNSCELRC